jgi:sulfur-carrier protein
MLIRYFGAAKAAAGVEQETLEFGNGATLADVIGRLAELHPEPAVSYTPTLATVMGKSSFLRNEVALRDFHLPLEPTDVIDILPPFAGG